MGFLWFGKKKVTGDVLLGASSAIENCLDYAAKKDKVSLQRTFELTRENGGLLNFTSDLRSYSKLMLAKVKQEKKDPKGIIVHINQLYLLLSSKGISKLLTEEKVNWIEVQAKLREAHTAIVALISEDRDLNQPKEQPLNKITTKKK